MRQNEVKEENSKMISRGSTTSQMNQKSMRRGGAYRQHATNQKYGEIDAKPVYPMGNREKDAEKSQ